MKDDDRRRVGASRKTTAIIRDDLATPPGEMGGKGEAKALGSGSRRKKKPRPRESGRGEAVGGGEMNGIRFF
jgi:hypothetical protein